MDSIHLPKTWKFCMTTSSHSTFKYLQRNDLFFGRESGVCFASVFCKVSASVNDTAQSQDFLGA